MNANIERRCLAAIMALTALMDSLRDEPSFQALLRKVENGEVEK